MSISENIKELRTRLKMTQQEFADRIGVKRNTVATYEMGRSVPSDAAIVLICKEFDVRREWLETGEGQIYVQRSTAILEQLTKEYHLDERSRTLVENFLSLTPENRKMVIDAFDNAVRLMTRKPDDELTREEMHARLDEEIDEVEAARKRGTETSSASIGTSGSFLRSIKGKT